jgi:ubiquinone/menaquinone biosynthesis C-methylase UbiE
MAGAHPLANQALLRTIEDTPYIAPASWGSPGRYAAEDAADNAALVSADRSDAPRRDWEHWNAWSRARIQDIVDSERSAAAGNSTRDRLARMLGMLGLEDVLDLGCGPGALWIRFPDTVRVVGVDVSHSMAAAARANFPSTPLLVADGAALPLRAGCVDAVVLRHVAEHLPDPVLDAVLLESTRVARRAVVLEFFLPPRPGAARSRRVGEGFLEVTRDQAAVVAPFARAGWKLSRRDGAVWAFRPAAEPLVVSIVMPTYRRAHRLARTIEQVVGQVYPHWELVVVNNAADEVLDASLGADPRVRIVEHSGTASASYARNRGLEHVTGDLVAFFDDDDMFPHYLQRVVAAFEAHPAAKMVRCGMVVSDGSTNLSHATPECMLRRGYATPTWPSRPSQDQQYYTAIVNAHHWSVAEGDIVVIDEPLCRANWDCRGGLRAGAY